jgi:hypothetical protein
MDVPEIVLLAFDPPTQPLVMDEPGAKMSRHDPKFEKLDRWSDEVVAPTVIAEGADAGERRHASTLSLPAATTTEIPSATARSTASFSDGDWAPPRLMFRTAGTPDR